MLDHDLIVLGPLLRMPNPPKIFWCAVINYAQKDKMRYRDLLTSSDPTLRDFFLQFDVEHDPAEYIQNILIILKNELEEARRIQLEIMYGDVEENLKQRKTKAEIDQIRAKTAETRAKTSTENNRH